MIKRYLDYRRRKAIIQEARNLWYTAYLNRQAMNPDTAVDDANKAVKAFYDAFLNHKP